MRAPEAALLLGLAAGAGACGRGRGAPARPNVLLVSVDTLRADHLSCYGYERATSQRLDGLAAEGVLFERCLSTSSWTLPAHLSMLTGLPLSAHGGCDDRLWTRVDEAGEPLPVPLRGRFVSEALSRAGYRTGGFYTWKYLEPAFGFGPGFETWERLGHTFYSHPEVGPEFERLRAAGDIEGQRALAARWPELFDDRHPSSAEVVDRALAWLGEGRATADPAPFFLFVHLFDVHDPYTPPAPFDTRFDPGYEGPIDGRRVTSPDSPVRGDMDPRDLAHLVALYDGEIAWVDSQLGRLFDGLAALGLERDTLVVVTADHGEEFFEHGHKTHRRQLHVESVGVPLLVRWPGTLPAGRRVRAPAGLADVAPTILAAAGVEPLAPMAGEDLLPLARGEGQGGARTLVTELLLFDDGPVPERQVGLLEGERYTILHARGGAPWEGVALDLAADARGRGPGAPLAGGALDAARTTLDRARVRLRAWRDRAPPMGVGSRPLAERDLAELEALGYGGARQDDGTGAEESAGADALCLDGCLWPR